MVVTLKMKDEYAQSRGYIDWFEFERYEIKDVVDGAVNDMKVG